LAQSPEVIVLLAEDNRVRLICEGIAIGFVMTGGGMKETLRYRVDENHADGNSCLLSKSGNSAVWQKAHEILGDRKAGSRNPSSRDAATIGAGKPSPTRDIASSRSSTDSRPVVHFIA
jgi:hypothetical protein